MSVVVDDARLRGRPAARLVAEVAPRPVPAGFAEAASGLVVPTEHHRLRIIVAKDEWRALYRAIEKCLGPHRLKFELHCDVEGCPRVQIEKVRDLDGTVLLRCGHADRVLAAWV